ncbi:MAG: hypothetical protein V7K77_16450, partial [Nostoc sp.]|uniref:hypothetical protein n=1 Tax=Nostoc sp. TaxID=1180 RepID=UPI002FF7CAEA
EARIIGNQKRLIARNIFLKNFILLTHKYMLYSVPSQPKSHDCRLNAISIHIASNYTFWL